MHTAAEHGVFVMRLQRPGFVKLVAQLPGLSERMWLHGPAGSELYQETLVR